MQERLWDKSLNVLVWPSQSPDLNSFEHLWRDLKIAVQWCSLSNLTEFERICREEWEKLRKYRCAKLVASNPRRLKAVITAKGAWTKYWINGLGYFIIIIFLNTFSKISTKLFLLCHYRVLCVDWWEEKTNESIFEQSCNVTECGKSQGVWILSECIVSDRYISVRSVERGGI